jgi:hypothetical protein
MWSCLCADLRGPKLRAGEPEPDTERDTAAQHVAAREACLVNGLRHHSPYSAGGRAVSTLATEFVDLT